MTSGFSEISAVIACAHGLRGPNTEYLFNLVDQLRAQGLSAEELAALLRLEAGVKALLPDEDGGAHL